MKAFFFQNHVSYYHQQVLISFSKINFFSDFCKKPSIRVEKRHLYEITSFDMRSTAFLPPLTILKKNTFSFKKLIYVFKDTHFFAF